MPARLGSLDGCEFNGQCQTLCRVTSRHRMPVPIGQQWCCAAQLWIQTQPCTNFQDGRFPQRNRALLAALALQGHTGCAIKHDVRDARDVIAVFNGGTGKKIPTDTPVKISIFILLVTLPFSYKRGKVIYYQRAIPQDLQERCSAKRVKIKARRLLRLTLLAPAVVEGLLANPDVAVNLESVLRRVMPLDWREQSVLWSQ